MRCIGCSRHARNPFIVSRARRATVEMAVVAPVLIVLALIVYNIMMFLSATARFDRVAPDIVLAHAVSPVGVDEQGGVGCGYGRGGAFGGDGFIRCGDRGHMRGRGELGR